MDFAWLEHEIGDYEIDAIPGDASTRKFWRVKGDKPYILMSAPLPEHRTPAFISIAKSMRDVGLNAPEVYAEHNGELLMTDLGHSMYLDVLKDTNADMLYSRALEALIKLQEVKVDVPDFDEEHMLEELARFPTYYLPAIGVEPLPGLDAFFQMLVKAISCQPYGIIHRDYHSRNLLLCPGNTPGIIDFQDMMTGPLLYDAVSLLEDAYIDWPLEKRLAWYDKFKAMLKWTASTDYYQAVHEVALQRQIKVLGIFGRLAKNGKPEYLNDVPRILNYMRYHIQELNWCPPAIARYFELQIFDKLPKVARYA